MRYNIRLHAKDECTFAGMLKSTPFTYRIIGQCMLTGALHALVELPGEQSEISFFAGLLRLARSQTWHNSDWVETHERVYARELLRYEESTAEFLESFSEEMEAASKKILKEEEEQKAKEQEEQRAKEEEDQKLKKIKDEEDAKLTALISYFYNRN